MSAIPGTARRFAGTVACLVAMTCVAMAEASLSQRVSLAVEDRVITIPFDGREIEIKAVSRTHYVPKWPNSVVFRLRDRRSSKSGSAGLWDTPWINHDQWVGVTRLHASDREPSILFEAYTGDTRCCSVMAVLRPAKDGLKRIMFREAEGELRAALPLDIDGDGILDIVRQGERDCFGRKICKVRNAIYNVIDGKLYDVTGNPRFRSYLESFSKSGEGE
jgi:hypothetical protein